MTKPTAFEKVTLDSNTANPMELDIAPDGRVFYIERDGRVQIIRPSTGTTVTAIDLDVFSGNEDGLLGLRLDPAFATNGWVYLYYSPTSGSPRNQISRFTVAGDTIALNTERVMLQVPTQRNTCCHQGGSMTFDTAGNLYLATGDNTNPFEADGFAPIDERPGRQDFDAQRTSGNTNDLRGKILRIRPATDGTYTIPAGNLFAPGTANTSARYVRMTLTANTGWPAAQLPDLQVMGTGGGGDLALNKPATVSSTTQTFAGTNAVDGNDNTYWESAAGFPQQITIDLGSVQTVSSVQVKLPNLSDWGTRTQSLTTAVSTNNVNYTNVSGPTVMTFNVATGNSVAIPFAASQARYIRITFTSNSGAAGAQAATISVFGPVPKGPKASPRDAKHWAGPRADRGPAQ